MSKQFANIHDAFFKQVLSDPNLAGTFLSEHLPPEVASLPDCIDLVLAEAPGLEEKDLLVILTYLDRGSIALDNKVVYEALQRLVPDRKERIMGWLTQPYYDKGKAEGRAEGEARGEAKILTRLLEIRFGAIPVALHERIFAADVASIETWVERAFEAPDLQSVFDSN
jgi:hypothetical protein